MHKHVARPYVDFSLIKIITSLNSNAHKINVSYFENMQVLWCYKYF